MVRQLSAEGVTIIYVSHHLQEVLALADRITVMRDGRTIETIVNRNVSEDRIIRAMVGRDLGAAIPWSAEAKARAADASPMLEVKDLHAPGLDTISFTVGAGEILGIGGLPDSGKDGLGEALFGLGGAQRLGNDRWCSVAGQRSAGGDPQRHGLRSGRPPRRRRPADDERRRQRRLGLAAALSACRAFCAAAPSGARRVPRWRGSMLESRISARSLATLSGGNQQKIILGRSLVTHPRVLVLHEPTRGIDVGAKAEIYADPARHRWRRRGDRA